MNRNTNFKTLDEKKKEYKDLKAEWEKLKDQEKQLKEKFYSSPFEERAKIKQELKTLQDVMFKKNWECGKSMRIDIENEKMIQKLKNPTGSATDPHHLTELIKKEMRKTLDGSRKFKDEDEVGDIWPVNHNKEICYFGENKEINELIANLERNRKKTLDNDRITTRMVKQEDFSSTDFNEMIRLVHQVRNFLKEKAKQKRQEVENIKLNNLHLFTQWRCSTDGEYNGRGRWENWHTFSGKHRGFGYTIYVPDNHIALTNCLFDNGWGTNSEVGKFFVVRGIANPQELSYWNVKKQRYEVVSEEQVRHLPEKDRIRVGYHTYVELNDKIWIDHYRGDIKQELAKSAVSGTNELVESNDHKNISGKIITKQVEKNQQSDNEFLLKYFKEHNIKEISLTAGGNLSVKYNNGQNKIIENSDQRSSELISYLQKNNRIILNSEDLVNMTNSNLALTEKDKLNNAFLIGGELGIALIIVITIRFVFLKNKQK